MRWRGSLRLLVLIPLLSLLVVAGAIATRRMSRDPTSRVQVPATMPSQFPESSIAADCGLSQIVGAWTDTDANGQREMDEPPLAGVEFFVVSTTPGQDPWDYGRMAVSDDTGTAELRAFIAGCGKPAFDISARPPAGYRATTGDRMLLESYGSERRIEFGFVAAP